MSPPPSPSKHFLPLSSILLLTTALLPRAAAADTPSNVFNMTGPGYPKSLLFSPVGDPGNAPDTNGTNRGAVPYNYAIGTYDVTSAQYAAFLNAVATTSDTYNLYNPKMANPGSAGIANVGCGIIRNGASGSYTYTVTPDKENFPVNFISFGDSARFTNWLDNGQPTGAQGPGTTETGAYTLNGATTAAALASNAISRNAGATYVLPSDNEWYKAAYYKGRSINAGYWSWATQSNDPPQPFVAPPGIAETPGGANESYTISSPTMPPQTFYVDPVNYLTSVGAYLISPGPYGTFDQAGDVGNWTQGNNDQFRSAMGDGFAASWENWDSHLVWAASGETDATAETSQLGFRVVELPEPRSLSFLAFGATGLLIRRRQT